MGLLEETHAAGDLVVDIVAGQFHLQLHGVVVSAVEDGDIGEIATRIDQCADPLEDEAGLSAGIHHGDEVGLFAVGAHGAEFLKVALARRLVAQHGVGEG